MNTKYIFIFLFVLNMGEIYAQEILTKENAANIALENNYGIKMANNNVKVAENNADILNTGFLPSISASAGGTYTNNSTELTAHSGETTDNNNAESRNYNGSIALNYTLFDGFGRSYNFKKLKETHNLSKLQAQTVIENNLLQVFSLYYEVAFLTETQHNISASLEISKERLKRTTYGFDYGQNTKLQLLNAQVDVNSDSIRFINSQRLLNNAKRDLNLLLGRSIDTEYEVDTVVSFDQFFDLNNVLDKSAQHNVEIQKVLKEIEISEFDIKINSARLLPSVRLNSSYGFQLSNNDRSFNYAEQLSKGLNTGLSISWNIFDGGSTKTRIKNARIAQDNLEVEKNLIESELQRNVTNALEVYTNALFILEAERQNLETNSINFNRTEEQFKLGQVTSIEFRQAQLNLLNARSNLSQAKYDAKNAELRLLQLSGDLLNTEF